MPPRARHAPDDTIVKIDFHPSRGPTLGVEWELALVDRASRDLVNAAPDLLSIAQGRLEDPSRLHTELLRNTIEVVTGVCGSVPEAAEDLARTVATVQSVAHQMGIDLFGAGTHPFARWSSAQLSPGHRYEELIERTQWWGRQMLIWGVHVHVGLRHRDHVLPILGALLHQFPHLQALSASSPIWEGTDTGYASNRAMMFQQLPTAGLPFQFDSWAQYESFVADQMTTGVIDELTEIRWDIRPSPALGTIEVRVCDGISTLRELRALTALIHCLVVDLEDRLERGETLTTLPPWHVQENKWRAARYGLDAWIILDAASRERLVVDDLADLLERLEPVARRLDCADDLRAVARIPEEGASYQRQRAVAEATGGDLRAVVASVVRELYE